MADIAKIKRNIQRMIDQDAPESDIDAYVASEGVTLEELRADKGVSTTEDVLKSTGAGFGQGLIDTAGAYGDARKMGADILNWGAGKLGIDTPAVKTGIDYGTKLLMGPFGNMPTSGAIKQGVEAYTGDFYEPQTTAGEYGGMAGRFAGNSVIGPGKGAAGLASRLGRGAAAGLASEAAGQATEGTMFEPAARIAGGIAGGLSPELMKGGWNLVRMAMRGVDDKAANRIMQQMANSGMTPDEALAKVRELGPEGMLADVSPQMQVVTGGTAIADPSAGQVIASRLAQRREGAPGRVAGALDEAMGPYQDPQTLANSVRASQATASPAYRLLKDQAVDIEPAITQAMQEANRFGYNSPIGNRIKSVLDMLATPEGTPIANGERVHAVRVQLDDMIEAAQRAGNGKEAGVLSGLRKTIDNVLKEQVPGLAEADKMWADAAKIKQAYEFGQDELLSKKIFPGQLEKQLGSAADPEKLAMTQGARAKLAMDFSGAAKNPTMGLERTLQGAMNEQKLQQLIGPEKLGKLGKALDTETTFLETSALGEPARGSRTAVIDAARDIWGTGGKPGAISDVVAAGATGTAIGGGPTGAAAGGAVAINRLVGRISQAFQNKSKPAVVKAAAEILTATGGNLPKAIQLLNEAAVRLKASSSDKKMMLNALLATRPAMMPAPSGQ